MHQCIKFILFWNDYYYYYYFFFSFFFTLQPWMGLGLFNNSIPFLSVLYLRPPTNFHPLGILHCPFQIACFVFLASVQNFLVESLQQ